MAGTGLLSRSEVKSRHYKRHEEKGLCRQCSKKAAEGRKLCQKHLDYAKKMAKNRRKIIASWRKNEHKK